MRKLLKPVALDRAPRYREAAYAAIKEAILAGQFEPGQPLVEEQIAVALQISRTPVREALAILEHEELIGPRNGRGLYVRPLTREEFVALFVANEAVEPFVVRHAARLATPAQLAESKAAIERGKRAVAQHDIAGALRSGRDFHRLMGVASGNPALTEFVARNEERADLYLLSYEKAVDAAGMDASNHEHEAIYHAVAQRDPEAAARLVIYHSQSVRGRLSALFASEADGVRESDTLLAVAD
jgi:DNA-binding GntR family transcriptional regulator